MATQSMPMVSCLSSSWAKMCIRDRGKRTNTILQSAFFKLAKVMPEAEAIQYMKDAATHSYLKKGQDIVDMNHKAIDAGASAFTKFEVPASWKDAVDAPVEKDVYKRQHQPCVTSLVVESVKDAVAFAEEIGYPVIVRPAYTLGGTGGGIAYDLSLIHICTLSLKSILITIL